jgi:hypothetical protein
MPFIPRTYTTGIPQGQPQGPNQGQGQGDGIVSQGIPNQGPGPQGVDGQYQASGEWGMGVRVCLCGITSAIFLQNYS